MNFDRLCVISVLIIYVVWAHRGVDMIVRYTNAGASDPNRIIIKDSLYLDDIDLK